LDEISRNSPPKTRPHILARHCNLEWVFAKNTNTANQEVVGQVAQLAAAVHVLPEHWPTNDPDATRELIESWLALPQEKSWSPQAWYDAEKCHPPIHDIEDRHQGLFFLRWFIQRILPYPCFLWNERRLAARLRVTVQSLAQAMDGGLQQVFAGAEYTGQLRSFLGKRWWRSGCESILWEITEENPFDPAQTRDILNKKCSNLLAAAQAKQPVICIDANTIELDEFSDIESAVRVQPDDWPIFADQAWTSIDLAKESPKLGAIAIEDDRAKIYDATDAK
jgi:hypothetical protein